MSVSFPQRSLENSMQSSVQMFEPIAYAKSSIIIQKKKKICLRSQYLNASYFFEFIQDSGVFGNIEEDVYTCSVIT